MNTETQANRIALNGSADVSQNSQNGSNLADIKQGDKIMIEQQQRIFQVFHPKTECDRDAFSYCCQQQCYEDAAICSQFCHKCEKNHEECLDFKLAKNIYKQIDKSIIKMGHKDKQIFKKMESKIDGIVDDVSALMNSLKKQTKFFGLNQKDREILFRLINRQNKQSRSAYCQEIFQILKNNQFSQDNLSGSQMFNIFDKYFESKKNWFGDSLRRFKSIVSETKSEVCSLLQQIQQLLLDFHIQHHQNSSSINQFENSIILNQGYYQKNYLIAPQNNLLTKFQSILKVNFPPSSIIKKIFTFDKATSHYFNWDKFEKTIQGKRDTIFIIQNQHKKRFGFCTQGQFTANNPQWINQQNAKSLIFSLDASKYGNIAQKQFNLYYNNKEKLISLGNYKQKNNSNGFEISFEIPRAQIMLLNTSRQKNTFPAGLFGSSPNVNTIDYKTINGEKDTQGNYPLIQKLQVYLAQRPQ